MTTIPRIVIAGTHSGCGKTTVASGIMAALIARGLKVQPFKVGPDFIDPSHHTRICGRVSRNLDPFMMGEDGCRETFHRSATGADIAVIEGVMGLFDGIDGGDCSSTAHVARILDAPILLVMDTKGMSRSAHAAINGYFRYDPALSFAGVIFNRIGSLRHRRMIERSLSVPSLGWIPKTGDLAVASRHLGLAMARESGTFAESGRLIEESCDIDAIIATARKVKPLPETISSQDQSPVLVKIGIASDEAFCFYYQDNLDRLSRAGADLVFFSPLRDRLPDVNAVYLCGGYPELFLPALESASVTSDLKNAADDGMPVYAECGGLMFLSHEISTDRTYRMCGILPAAAAMTGKIQALGYVKGMSTGSTSFLPPALEFTGHEFHYSRLDPDNDARFALELSRGNGIQSGKDGLTEQNVLGCYTHAYFTPSFARVFIRAAAEFFRR
ncbi:MAG: cobyrinate a,c-diamide synthase [Methanoregula sp.]|nr:cobyrinate a,c-diamide synthase [Methanoregula sp.]